MKLHKLIIYLLIASSFLIITACGGGGDGDSTGSGEVTMSITDAKPLLPEGATEATNLWVTFIDVLVHKSGGGWESLPLTGYPYTVDLLQLVDGVTMEIVPPVELEYGKYTQIRLVIAEEDGATIKFDNDDEFPVEIPSGNLKTDKNFTFDPQYPADIIIDFDLSQSLIVTDPFGTPSYKLKPVLHIVKASEAATINGEIAKESFIDGKNASVTVFYNSNPAMPGGGYVEYTKIEVQDSGLDLTEFSIYWLPPNVFPNDYRVEIDFDQDGTFDFEQFGIYLGIGDTFDLNGGAPI